MKKNVLFVSVLLLGFTAAYAATDCQMAFKGSGLTVKEQRDNINLPFKNDPEILGYWHAVDFVERPSQFSPSKSVTPRNELFLKEMIFLPEGKILGQGSTWTKGHILDPHEQTDEAYHIKTLKGKKYLFRQWKSGDYTCLGQKPSYYVLEKKAELRTDDLNKPFVDDPEVVGQWKTVDFVDKQEDFVPGKQATSLELYLKTLTFEKEGKMPNYPIIRWTKGFVMHQKDQTAAAYTLKEINGKKYMFFEWKSGDYSFRGHAPSYYVLEKVN